MAQTKIQTTVNDNSVADFLDSVPDADKRADSARIVKLISEHTGYEPKMWGPAIIGFGKYHYRYASAREGEMPLAAFSPRKQDITFYFERAFDGRDALLAKLGKHKTGKSCVYVKRLEDIDTEIIRKMIDASIAHTLSIYPQE